jgi:hypothetical protein
VGKREILIFLKRATICLSAGTVAGILLLMAVFALPTAPMCDLYLFEKNTYKIGK